jgi:hypothetical protein
MLLALAGIARFDSALPFLFLLAPQSIFHPNMSSLKSSREQRKQRNQIMKNHKKCYYVGVEMNFFYCCFALLQPAIPSSSRLINFNSFIFVCLFQQHRLVFMKRHLSKIHVNNSIWTMMQAIKVQKFYC